MQAKDVMTTQVITVTPGQTVWESAKLFVTHRVSAVPAVSASARELRAAIQKDLAEAGIVENQITVMPPPLKAAYGGV